MDAAESLVRRFPDLSGAIRRLQGEDATFRAICEDYADALRALEHWRGAGDSARQRVEEYRTIVTELEEEAFAVLKAHASS